MKISAKLLALLMLFGMPLAACNNGGNNDKPKDPDTEDVDEDQDEDEEEEQEDDDDDDEGGGEIVHKGTKSDPYTVSDALAFIATLDDDEYSDEKFVTGKVVEITNWSSAGRPTFTMGTASKALTVWSANALPGASGQNWLKANDTVVVSGALVNFKGNTPEMTYVKNGVSCSVVSVNGSTGGGGGGGQQDDDEGGGGGGQVTGDGVLFDFASTSDVSGSSSGVSYASAKASGQSAPAYNSQNKELRLYAKNTLTISASSAISKINFVVNSCTDDKTKVDFASASPGSYSKGTWTGSASSVTFTCPDSGQVHIQKIEVVLGEGGGGGSGEGGGGGQTSSDAESIMQLICLDLAGDDSLYDDDGEGGFETCLAGDEFDESGLVDEVEYVLGLLPEDFFYYDEPAEDEDEYGLFAYGSAANDDGIFVEVYTYNDDGDGVYEIYVYPIEWED